MTTTPRGSKAKPFHCYPLPPWGHPQQNQQTTHPMMLPPPGERFHHQMVSHPNGSVYLYGGMDENNNFVEKLFRFTPEKQWEEVVPVQKPVQQQQQQPNSQQQQQTPESSITLPPARYCHAMCLRDHAQHQKLIIYGGYTDGQDAPTRLADLWEYDLISHQWSEIKATNAPKAASKGASKQDNADKDDSDATALSPHVPPPLTSHSLSYHKLSDSLILFGGSDGTKYLNDVWQFTFTNNKWKKLKPKNNMVPIGRYGHTAVWKGKNELIIFGGGTFKSLNLNDVVSFSLKNKAWKEIKVTGDKPKKRNRHGACVLDNHMYIFGGAQSQTNMLSDMHALNFAKNSWSKVEVTGETPMPRSGHSMCSLPGEKAIVIYAGDDGQNLLHDTLHLLPEGVAPHPALLNPPAGGANPNQPSMMGAPQQQPQPQQHQPPQQMSMPNIQDVMQPQGVTPATPQYNNQQMFQQYAQHNGNNSAFMNSPGTPQASSMQGQQQQQQQQQHFQNSNQGMFQRFVQHNNPGAPSYMNSPGTPQAAGMAQQSPTQQQQNPAHPQQQQQQQQQQQKSSGAQHQATPPQQQQNVSSPSHFAQQQQQNIPYAAQQLSSPSNAAHHQQQQQPFSPSSAMKANGSPTPSTPHAQHAVASSQQAGPQPPQQVSHSGTEDQSVHSMQQQPQQQQQRQDSTGTHQQQNTPHPQQHQNQGNPQPQQQQQNPPQPQQQYQAAPPQQQQQNPVAAPQQQQQQQNATPPQQQQHQTVPQQQQQQHQTAPQQQQQNSNSPSNFTPQHPETAAQQQNCENCPQMKSRIQELENQVSTLTQTVQTLTQKNYLLQQKLQKQAQIITAIQPLSITQQKQLFIHNRKWYIPADKIQNIDWKNPHHGSYSNVYRGEYNEEEVAVKRIDMQRIAELHDCPIEKVREIILNEVFYMIKVNNQHVVKPFGVSFADRYAMVVMEWCISDLGTYLRNNALNMNAKVRMLVQTAQAMAAIHHEGIVHRDLKPRNILIQENGIVKIIDFGISREDSSSSSLVRKNIQNNFLYVAPELYVEVKPDATGSENPHKEDPFTKVSDIYAFGMIMYFILTGHEPLKELFTRFSAFPHKFLNYIVKEKVHPDVSVESLQPQNCPPLLVNLLQQCTEHQPEKRIQSFEEIVNKLTRGE